MRSPFLRRSFFVVLAVLLSVLYLQLLPGEAEARKKVKAPAASGSSGPSGPAVGRAVSLREAADKFYREGNWDEARRKYEQALEEGARKDDPVLYYNLAISCVQLSIPDRARKAFAEARNLLLARLEKNPKKPAVADLYYIVAIGNNPVATGEAAVPDWKKYAVQAADLYRKGAFGRQLEGADYFRLSKIFEFLKEPEAAELMDRAAAAYEKKGKTNDPYYAIALAQKGMDEFRKGDLPAAEALLGKAVEANPYVSGGFWNLGMVLVGQGKYDKAEETFRRGVYRDRRYMTDCNYSARLLQIVNRYRAEHPTASLQDWKGLGRGVLEARIVDVAKEAAEILTQILTVRSQGGTSPSGPATVTGDEQAFREAQYRMAQGLLEYARQGYSVGDFALQSSLIGLIFDRQR